MAMKKKIKNLKFNPFIITGLLIISLCMLLILAIIQPGSFSFFSGTVGGGASDWSNSHRFDVKVINGFTNNSSLPLVIWCGSKNTDMGGRALQEGDDYSWTLQTGPRFLVSVWGLMDGAWTRNIFCTMKWDQRRKKFDAFEVSRDRFRCSPRRMCLWLVKEDGFYFSNDGFNFNKDFSWS